MIKDKVSINIISSFNHANFIGLLENNNDFKWQINDSNYNQIFQILSDRKLNIWKKKSDISLIWSTPESISPEFKKLLNHEKANKNIIKKDIDFFFNCLRTVKKNSDIILIPNWILREPNESSIALSFSKKLGIEYHLSYMNYYLSELMNKEKNFYLLNSTKWLTNCGSEATYNSKLWYLMKSPFSNEFYNEAILDVVSIFKTLKGLSKKLLVLDLDNTLWGGIVGDVGWKNLRIGGHDYLGEAFKDFQYKIKSLKNYGILLALCSKNNESTALEAIEKHPEMVLKLDDFVSYKINWNNKAKNILDITKELNIGLQSVVFLDDTPYERAYVKESLPEVTVPNLPLDPVNYSSFLSKLRYFDTSFISKEDKKRADLYKSEFKREKIKQNLKSDSQWLKTLELKVTVENAKSENLPRTHQLLNKTNQMNLTTRRLSEKELNSWKNKSSNKLWTIRAKDKFGDYGIIGIVSISIKNKSAKLEDFILSCRVVGRNIEKVMIEFVKDYCQKAKIDKIKGKYLKTKKNALLFEYFKKLDLIDKNKHSFEIIPDHKKFDLSNINIIKKI
jgi:FkbH-like protein